MDEIIAIARAILVNEEGQILLLCRSADAKHHPRCWEFPGGGMTQNESLGEALGRELREELGMEIERSRLPVAYVALSTGEFPHGFLSDPHVELYGLKSVTISGSEVTATGPEWGFFTPDRAAALSLTPSAEAALDDLRLFPLTRS